MFERHKVAALSSPKARRKTARRKRALDIAIGSVLTILTAPLLVVLGLAMAISLRAWPLFRHWRLGQEGRPIRVVKLRTLPTTTPPYADKFMLDIENIPLPWLCRVMRRTHLDELPQLWLVVAGKMSLVGPRPVQSPEIEPVEETFNAQRSAVRPGCTGLWQISRASTGTATSAPELDLFYIANASTRFDLWILVRTVMWMTCLARPVGIEDVPTWALGAGLAADNPPAPIHVTHRRHLKGLVAAHLPHPHLPHPHFPHPEEDVPLAAIGD